LTWKKDLRAFTESRADRLDELTGIYPTQTVVNKFVAFVDKELFKQIIFEFGHHYLEVALSYLESVENYETCALIIKQLEESNKERKENIKLKVW
jgi:nucleoside permease NupC